MTTLRPVRPDDAGLLLAVNTAQQLAVLGRPDSTLADCADQLADPDLLPGSLVAVDGDRPLGCALVFADGSSSRNVLDVVVDPAAGPGLQRLLLRAALDLAVTTAQQRGCTEVTAEQGCYRDDTGLAAVLRETGFSPATAFHRMRRELDAPVEVHVPAGVTVTRHDDPDLDDLRRAHRLHQSTFVGHHGFVPRSWEDWLAGVRSRTGARPLWFAALDGRDAGFLQENDQFLEDEGAGYVWRLGVEREARGRGVARALLLSSFAHLRERGRRAVLLHVDTANATGAPALYASVGMHPSVVIDAWRWTWVSPPGPDGLDHPRGRPPG